jgi:hypothetical protein
MAAIDVRATPQSTAERPRSGQRDLFGRLGANEVARRRYGARLGGNRLPADQVVPDLQDVSSDKRTRSVFIQRDHCVMTSTFFAGGKMTTEGEASGEGEGRGDETGGAGGLASGRAVAGGARVRVGVGGEVAEGGGEGVISGARGERKGGEEGPAGSARGEGVGAGEGTGAAAVAEKGVVAAADFAAEVDFTAGAGAGAEVSYSTLRCSRGADFTPSKPACPFARSSGRHLLRGECMERHRQREAVRNARDLSREC